MGIQEVSCLNLKKSGYTNTEFLMTLSKKHKPTLESLLAENKVLTGKEIIKRQKAKEEQLAEFAKAVEFEQRNNRVKAK